MDTSSLAGSALDAAPAASGGDVVLLATYVALALLFSFLCSIAEAALLSITPSYIASLKESEPRKAETLRRLKEDEIDRSLAAILTVNTIAHTVGAIGAGSKATAVFGDVWFGVFSAVMTLLILFVSEIVPKTLGAVYWRQLAGPTATYVNLLVKAMYPLIWVSEKLTRLISGGSKDAQVSRDEIAAMAGVGREHGVLNERESRIIRNLLLFQSLDAASIMTPRSVVTAMQKDLTVREALESSAKMPFSRLPLYDRDLDSVAGFVLLQDLLVAQSKRREQGKVSDFLRPMLAVPDSAPLSRLLETLLEQRQHIALVVGEYGETKGIVTLEDVVETLLGIEIVDEGDKVDDMQQLARRLWARRAKRMGISMDSG